MTEWADSARGFGSARGRLGRLRRAAWCLSGAGLPWRGLRWCLRTGADLARSCLVVRLGCGCFWVFACLCFFHCCFLIVFLALRFLNFNGTNSN